MSQVTHSKVYVTSVGRINESSGKQRGNKMMGKVVEAIKLLIKFQNTVDIFSGLSAECMRSVAGRWPGKQAIALHEFSMQEQLCGPVPLRSAW